MKDRKFWNNFAIAVYVISALGAVVVAPDSILWLIIIILGGFILLIVTSLMFARDVALEESWLSIHGPNIGLDEKAITYLGKKLWVTPHDAWDLWVWSDQKPPSEPPVPPEPFQMRFLEVTSFPSRSNVKGGIGKVEYKGLKK